MLGPAKRGRKRRTRTASSALPDHDAEQPRPKVRRKQWSEESMAAALDAVVNGGMSVLRAATTHGVPRVTLDDRYHGRVLHGVKPGPKPYLTSSEENELCDFLCEMGKIGYGKTRKQVKDIAEAVAREKGTLRNNKISDGWFRRFLERNPMLSLRKGDSTAAVRMNALEDKERLDSYFDLLKEVLEENDLMDRPCQIYNVDESGMPLEQRPPRLLVKRGQRKVRYRTSGNKSQVTVVGCVNAAGNAMPPFVIFNAKRLNMDWTKGEIPGTTYGLSDSGWIDAELFKGWFNNHFLKNAVSARPLLLLMDGHSSHYNPEAIHLAKANDVILFTLIPHTTHEMQPLDTSVFAPLKKHWQDACHSFTQKHPGTVISKYTFTPLLAEAWSKTMNINAIANGFKFCGVYPFNREIVLKRVSTNTVSASTSTPLPTAIEAPSHDSDKENHIQFTVEQEERFKRRLAEGYDLPDPEYELWLRTQMPNNDVGVAEFPLTLIDSILPCESPILPSLPLSPVQITDISLSEPSKYIHLATTCTCTQFFTIFTTGQSTPLTSPRVSTPLSPLNSPRTSTRNSPLSPLNSSGTSKGHTPTLNSSCTSKGDSPPTMPGVSTVHSPVNSPRFSTRRSPLSPLNSSPSTSRGHSPTPTSPSTSRGHSPTPTSPSTSRGHSPTLTSPGVSVGHSPTLNSSCTSKGDSPPTMPGVSTVHSPVNSPRFSTRRAPLSPLNSSPSTSRGHSPTLTSPGVSTGDSPTLTSPSTSRGHSPTLTSPGVSTDHSPTLTPPHPPLTLPGIATGHTPLAIPGIATGHTPLALPGVATSLSPISKYLIQYVPVTPVRTRPEKSRVAGERVLTSAEGLAMLKEKEEKKQKEEEERKKRKHEREMKRKEKQAAKALKSTKRKGKQSRPKAKKTVSETTETGNSETSSSCICNVCSESYEDDVLYQRGGDWVECGCQRWIHEKCITRIEMDSSGIERFCSVCVV